MPASLSSRWPHHGVITTVEKRPLDVDESLIEHARTAGPEGFRPIFTRYSKPILMFIYNLTGDRDRAEELTQETFIRAYRKLDTLRGNARFSTWLFGIARNVVREAIKAKYRSLRSAAPDGLVANRLPDTKARPDERVISEELSGKIRDALLRLPEGQRTVFILKLITSMRYEEISDVTGSSIGKLKTDLHRARRRMREELQPYLRDQSSGKRGAL